MTVARRLCWVALVVAFLRVLVLLVFDVPAIAGPPEKPEGAPATEVKATTATLHGVLDPGKTGGPFEADTYEFVYRQSVACKGAGEVRTVVGLSLGGGKEEVSQGVEGLVAGEEYTVCVVVHDLGMTEEVVGLPISFTTAVPPEAPETSMPAGPVTATTAVFEGVLNPKAGVARKAGWYFAYAPEGPCTGVSTTPVEPEVVVKSGKEHFSVSELQPNQKYVVCMVATNSAGETAAGNEVSFETPKAPPAIVSQSAFAISASEVRLEALVDPNNELTECHFEYGEVSVSEHELPCETPTLEGGTQGVGLTVTGLTQHTIYHYRVVVSNVTGTTEGTPVEVLSGTPERPVVAAASELLSSSATLNGVLNAKHAGEPGTYEFVYRQSPVACQGPGEITTSQAKSVGNIEEAASVGVSGLSPGFTYTYCLIAHNELGETAISTHETFTLAVTPTVGGESFSKVSSSEATLNAQVNPGGSQTTYYFEYGPTEHGSTPAQWFSTPAASAGAGPETVNVQATVEGLTPETEYDFRILASNTKTTIPVAGNGDSFSTYPVPLQGLPDERGYELVSPLDNGDATPLSGRPIRAAADGTAIAYVGSASPTGGNGLPILGAGQKRPEGTNVYLAKRPADGGWSATDIQPTGLDSAQYQGFSDDLSVGILGSNEALFAGAPNGEGQQGLYTHNNNTGVYQLLAANAGYEGATPNASHILIKNTNGLYDATAGQLQPINILPNGTPVPNATFGSPVGDSEPERQASSTGDLERVISDDGSRVFWTVLNGGQPEVLYVREDDTSSGAATVQVDAAEQGCEPRNNEPCSSGGGVFWTASSDGSKVFFTDDHRLTSNSTAKAGMPDLYEYDINSETGKPGTITDLTPDSNESANVVGVLGASEDGSYVYFAAAGALANSGASPQKCLPETLTRCNVYVLHAGEFRLAATVAEVDGVGNLSGAVVIFQGDGAYFGDWERNVGYRSAHVTPDGLHLVFESIENLTGFDSEGGREIYMYDYSSEGVLCVSCHPTGGGSSAHGVFGEFAHAELPESLGGVFGLRDVSVDGDRVFFVSNEGLVARVTNGEVPLPDYFGVKGLTNVFEWEREGTDAEGVVREGAVSSCPVKRPARPSGGCVFLLSLGTSSEMSFFLDASESGDDVFLMSRAELVARDRGETFEVYDARVGAPQELVEQVCTGSGCQGAPGTPPVFSTPSSVTFNGIGNFPAPAPVAVQKKVVKKVVKCAKGKRLVRGKCVKVKVKAKGRVGSKRVGKSGRVRGGR
jgi:hypothetical protein